MNKSIILVNQCYQLQADQDFIGEYFAMHMRDDVTMVDECKWSTSTQNMHVENCQGNTVHKL